MEQVILKKNIMKMLLVITLCVFLFSSCNSSPNSEHTEHKDTTDYQPDLWEIDDWMEKDSSGYIEHPLLKYLAYFYEDSNNDLQLKDTLLVYYFSDNEVTPHRQTETMFGCPIKYVSDLTLSRMVEEKRNFDIHELKYEMHPYQKIDSKDYFYVKEVNLYLHHHVAGEYNGYNRSFVTPEYADSVLLAWKNRQ